MKSPLLLACQLKLILSLFFVLSVQFSTPIKGETHRTDNELAPAEILFIDGAVSDRHHGYI